MSAPLDGLAVLVTVATGAIGRAIATALINLTKSIAQSFGAEGITAVALAPGWVRTEMAGAFIARHGEAAALSGILMGRMAFALRPSQVSLNGAVLDVNGGSYLR